MWQQNWSRCGLGDEMEGQMEIGDYISPKHEIKLKIAHDTEIDHWIAERHYLKSTPAGAIVRMEFCAPDNTRLGAMMWGRPTSPKVDQENIMELTRMYFVDETEHCIESKAFAMARKYIRKHYPKIKGLIAYSSTAEDHRGTIYKADGWFKIAESRSNTGNWENRQGRRNRDLSVKIKFARSP